MMHMCITGWYRLISYMYACQKFFMKTKMALWADFSLASHSVGI